MFKKIISQLFVFFLGTHLLFSVSSIAGPKFLTLKLSPKINALGQSYSALYNDIDAIEENPAGTIYAESFNLNLIATKWISDVNYVNAKAIIPLHIRSMEVLNLMLSSVFLFYPTIDRYDSDGNVVGNIPIFEGYTGAGLSTVFFDFLQTGFLFKFAYRSINQKNYPAMALDLGFQMPYLFKRSLLNFGLTIKNIGYDFNKNSLPTEFCFGASKDFLNSNLLLKLDLGTTGLNELKQFFNEYFISFGAEYNIYQILIPRIGFKLNHDSFSPAIGLGSGLKKFNRWNLYWTIDYTFIPKFDIEEYNNHQIAIGIRLYTIKEKTENILLYQKYRRFGMLTYLKGDLEGAIKYWEEALSYRRTNEIERLLEQTKMLLKEIKKRENRDDKK